MSHSHYWPLAGHVRERHPAGARKTGNVSLFPYFMLALAFIGLIHGPHLGWMVSPLVALGYAMFGVVCLLLSRQLPPNSAAAN